MKGAILFSLLFLTIVLSEEDDATVEFSSHLSDRPIENAKNASILTSDEIESRVHYSKDQHPMVSGMYENSSGIFEMKDTGNQSFSSQSAETNVSTNVTDGKAKLKVDCTPRIRTDEIPTVAMANSSTLMKVLAPPANKNATTGECVVVLFYSNQCVFSARMAPHFNALPRVFPDISFYAIDVVENGNLYVRYGLVYVPNVMLFHNSKPFARYNETVLSLEQFVKFINKLTGLEHNGTLNVTSIDMTGPVPSTITKKVDYVLIFAWIFTLSCMCFGFAKSSMCKRTIELLRKTWHEANASQHEHED